MSEEVQVEVEYPWPRRCRHRKRYRTRSNSLHKRILQTLSCCSSRYGGNSAVLGSLGESSVASRRTRGPVAFRPRLSAGLALSFVVLPLYAELAVFS